jgi:murein DD-endopeptidase MepM/ murein hydrolase activator NlpD
MHSPDTTPLPHGAANRTRRVAAVRAGRCLAAMALSAIAIAATGAAAPRPAEEAMPAPESIVAEPAFASETADDGSGFGAPEADLPRFEGTGLSDEAERLAADVGSASVQLDASAYAATTPEELAAARRDARIALVKAALRAGIPVDLSRFAEGGDAELASLGGLAWPLAGGSITDGFGARGGRHMGLDIAAPAGTPIAAAAPGIVILSSESHFGYGVAVIILHIDGSQTLYAHMTHGSRVVEAGDWVEGVDPIGLVGNTGRSFGAHLHFEVRIGGAAVDPLAYLTAGSRRPVNLETWTPRPGSPSRPAAPAQPAAVPSLPRPSQPAPKPSQTATPAPAPSATGTPTPRPTPTGTPTPTPSATPTPTPTPSATPSPAPVPSGTPVPSAPAPTTPPPSPSPSPSASTGTVAPSSTSTPTPSAPAE